MRNRAFTLIELLVVIGIIAILAGIAMPAFKAAQEHARAVQDLSNLRQLGIGLTAYLGDNSDSIMTQLTTTGTTSWPQLLGPSGAANYVSDWHVFQSPFDSRPYVSGSNVSYGMNNNIYMLASGSNTTTNFHYPSALMVFAPNPTLQNGSLLFAGSSSGNPFVTPSPGTRNGEYGNYGMTDALFMDAHVAAVTIANFNTSSYNAAPTNGQSEFWQPGAL